jgi:hypothetical protein
MVSDLIQYTPVTGMDAAALNPAFTLIATFPFPVSILRIINDSTVFISISYDGVNHHDYIPAHGELDLNTQQNNQPGNHRILFKKGQQVYAASNGAGVGSIVVAMYGQIDPTR